MFFSLSFYWEGFFIQTSKANRLLYFKTVSLTSICKLFLKDASANAFFRNTVDTAKNMCFTYSHLLWPPEKGVLKRVELSKTLSGGYLFVYPFSKDQILCNCKVNRASRVPGFSGQLAH